MDTENIRRFRFDRRFEGIVKSNHDFESTSTIDVLIPEFMTTETDSVSTVSEYVNTSNVINIEEFNIKEYIDSTNTINCRMIRNNNDSLNSMPENGDIVTIEFYNGNPKEPYFYNWYIASETEVIVKPKDREDIDDILNNYYRMVKLRQDYPMRGKDVDTMMQQLLNLDYPVNKTDGEWIYDEYNEGVVKNFQRDNMLEVDGIVGPITFTKIITNSRKRGFC